MSAKYEILNPIPKVLAAAYGGHAVDVCVRNVCLGGWIQTYPYYELLVINIFLEASEIFSSFVDVEYFSLNHLSTVQFHR